MYIKNIQIFSQIRINFINESQTRAEYIDTKLKASGWDIVEESKILREFRITEGKAKQEEPEASRRLPTIFQFTKIKRLA